MIVGELRELLARYPDSTPIFVDGYEDGLTRPEVRDARVRPMPESRRAWYYGEWEELTEPLDAGEAYNVGVVVGR